MKHTQGKWRHYPGRKKFKEAEFIVSKPDGTDASKVFVAKVYGHEGQPTQANARLIAAAPRLLTLLKDSQTVILQAKEVPYRDEVLGDIAALIAEVEADNETA